MAVAKAFDHFGSGSVHCAGLCVGVGDAICRDQSALAQGCFVQC